MSNLTIGKIVNNSVTLVLHTANLTAATRGQADRAIVPATNVLPETESHADFSSTYRTVWGLRTRHGACVA